MKCRKNVGELSRKEKQDFVDAVLALKNPARAPSRIAAAATSVINGGGTPNRYDDYVWIHNRVGSGAHRGPAFGPWHREFLRQFEYDLQQVSGNHHLMIPYWDWTTARTSASAGWPFTPTNSSDFNFMGGFGNQSTGIISNGPFADPTTFRINIRRVGDNDLTLKRSRGVPAGNFLPPRTDVLAAFGIGVPAGQSWPSIYDVAPLNTNPPNNQAQLTAQVNASFRKYLEYLLHDGIHVWIGGMWDFDAQGNPRNGGHMSFPPVAVNDPIFWLHHCNVDRLWAIWQRKSPTPAYVPLGTGTANNGHNGSDEMIRFENSSEFNTIVNKHPIDVLNHHTLDYWYHTDPPEIILSTPSVNFADVPDQLTSFRPVQFSVRTCQKVNFNITAISGGNFGIPSGQGTVSVDESETSTVIIANVYVQYQALGAIGTPQAGSVTIEASIVDVDGYDAANPGNTLVVGTWTVNLVATTVSRPRAAVSFVLDRSGSMSESAGVAGTKYDLLKSSLQVVADVMRDTDGLGIVSFDDAVTILNGISAMGPSVSPFLGGSGRAAVTSAIASSDLTPRGLTGIGQGMIAGASLLDAERITAATPYTQFALLVMTDGNENVAPSVKDAIVTAAINPYSSSIYAVGLGTPGNVSDTTLGAIARYMLVTGDITVSERRFRLTKYLIQILAGVSGLAIIVDPQGDLHIGTEHTIPFFVTESDVEVDVIVLCPIAPLLEFELETPDGTRIDSALVTPTIVLRRNLEDTFYRLTLPLSPGIRREGQWKAILRLTRDALQRNRLELDNWSQLLEPLRKTGALPYSVIVQTYTNLRLEVHIKPTVMIASENLALYAVLSEFGLPLNNAEITVSMTDPMGIETKVQLQPKGNGHFEGLYITGFPGLYQVRFMAIGYTYQRNTFQREETRTVSVFRERIGEGRGNDADDRERRGQTNSLDSRDLATLLREDREAFCRLLQTVIEDESFAKQVGLDAARAKIYLERYCGDSVNNSIVNVIGSVNTVRRIP